MSATLARDKIPMNQNIAGNSTARSNKPTIEVAEVFDTC